jgi:hypothetical protein
VYTVVTYRTCSGRDVKMGIGVTELHPDKRVLYGSWPPAVFILGLTHPEDGGNTLPGVKSLTLFTMLCL